MFDKIKNKFEPDFIGIGFNKCGTTWLAEMLGAHPEIGFSKIKEINFFNNVWAFADQRQKSKLEKEGIKSYEKYFNRGKSVGEWCVHYAPDPNVAGRIKHYFPNVKILVSLRNPVEKALSYYNFGKYVTLEEDSKTFEEAIKKRPAYIERSMYYPLLKRYFDLFPRRNIKVILFDEIKKDSRAVIKDLYSFLDVDSSFVSKDIDGKVNVAREVKYKFLNETLKVILGSLKNIVPKTLRPSARVVGSSITETFLKFNVQPLEKESMEDETKKGLLEIFRPDIEKTGKLIGRDLSAWSKRSEKEIQGINYEKT